jgi:hypothetical protein
MIGMGKLCRLGNARASIAMGGTEKQTILVAALGIFG